MAGYGLAVVPGAHVIAPLLVTWTPKHALVRPLAFYIVGNVISACLPSYAAALTGRITAAPAHGGYFRICAVLSGSLVPRLKQASAVAALYVGPTVALVLAVPVGALVGQELGWRALFRFISAIGVLARFGPGALVPRARPAPCGSAVPRAGSPRRSLLCSRLCSPSVAPSGLFAYIEPLLRRVTGYSAAAIL